MPEFAVQEFWREISCVSWRRIHVKHHLLRILSIHPPDVLLDHWLQNLVDKCWSINFRVGGTMLSLDFPYQQIPIASITLFGQFLTDNFFHASGTTTPSRRYSIQIFSTDHHCRTLDLCLSWVVLRPFRSTDWTLDKGALNVGVSHSFFLALVTRS